MGIIEKNLIVSKESCRDIFMRYVTDENEHKFDFSSTSSWYKLSLMSKNCKICSFACHIGQTHLKSRIFVHYNLSFNKKFRKQTFRICYSHLWIFVVVLLWLIRVNYNLLNRHRRSWWRLAIHNSRHKISQTSHVWGENPSKRCLNHSKYILSGEWGSHENQEL